jgi:predicted nucleic acid-binding protein
LLVTDAGVWVRALLDDSEDGPTRTRLRAEPYVDAPSLIDLEFLSAVRGLVQTRVITEATAQTSIVRFVEAPIDRHDHLPLIPRIWELRSNLTPYDASYVALAELLQVPLLTVDHRLARAPTIKCAVELAD